jgi:hypothetical protein
MSSQTRGTGSVAFLSSKNGYMGVLNRTRMVNDVDVTLNYTIDRYELPIAMTFSIGKAPTWAPIASARLIKLDPR